MQAGKLLSMLNVLVTLILAYFVGILLTALYAHSIESVRIDDDNKLRNVGWFILLSNAYIMMFKWVYLLLLISALLERPIREKANESFKSVVLFIPLLLLLAVGLYVY